MAYASPALSRLKMKGLAELLDNGRFKKNIRGCQVQKEMWDRCYVIYSFRLNIAGLKLNIEGLKVDLDYTFDDYGANFRAQLQRSPETVTPEGLIMGFLPIWLVDFFIPSNIESMTREFFQTLASGYDGQGVSMLFGSIPGETSKNNLWLLTDAEVLSNGTMKFAFNLQQKMVRKRGGDSKYAHSADIDQFVTIPVKQAEFITDIKTCIICKIMRIHLSRRAQMPGAIIFAVDKSTCG